MNINKKRVYILLMITAIVTAVFSGCININNKSRNNVIKVESPVPKLEIEIGQTVVLPAEVVDVLYTSADIADKDRDNYYISLSAYASRSYDLEEDEFVLFDNLNITGLTPCEGSLVVSLYEIQDEQAAKNGDFISLTETEPLYYPVSETSLKLVISPIAIEEIILGETEINMTLNESKKLEASFTPEHAIFTSLALSFDNDNVATISHDGVIPAVGEGSCNSQTT